LRSGAASATRAGRRFAQAARVLRPGGRLAISDIVSGRALKERTRRNVELWAACIAGAIPRRSYLEALEAQGLKVAELRKNDYRFISERALDACSTYEVESISLVAANGDNADGPGTWVLGPSE
jgi:arsenite methyltransferase